MPSDLGGLLDPLARLSGGTLAILSANPMLSATDMCG